MSSRNKCVAERTSMARQYRPPAALPTHSRAGKPTHHTDHIGPSTPTLPITPLFIRFLVLLILLRPLLLLIPSLCTRQLEQQKPTSNKNQRAYRYLHAHTLCTRTTHFSRVSKLHRRLLTSIFQRFLKVLGRLGNLQKEVFT